MRLALDLPKLTPFARTSPATLLQAHASKRPSELALAYEDERYNWRQLNDHANRYAAWFRARGVAEGDIIALMMSNCPDYLFAVMGLNKIGASASLINTNLTGAALAHAVRVCSAKSVLLGGEFASVMEDALDSDPSLSKLDSFALYGEGDRESDRSRRINEEIAASSIQEQSEGRMARGDDLFCYIYTSGTTGLPKAAIIRNKRMLGANITFGRMMHQCGPGDVVYVALPLYHSNAMMLGWGSALATGASVALRRKFSASGFWPDVRRFRATSFVYIGELCRYLLNGPERPDDCNHRLRVAVGNGLRPDIWERFQERFGVPVIREFYGSTEGNAPAVNFSGRPGMIGRLSPGQVIVRCDPATGELVRVGDGFCQRAEPGEVGLMLGKISKLMSFEGYADKQATDAKMLRDVFKKGDCYFNTGDLIQLHEKRWLSFADRLGDTFRWKGENVSTNEVAEILNGAWGVLESNVYGVQVPNTDGRAGMAAINVDEAFDLEAFAGFVATHLAAFQRPIFLRVLQGGMQVTGTLKHQKGDYRNDGFDPSVICDPLYFFLNSNYVPIDTKLHAKLESGEITP